MCHASQTQQTKLSTQPAFSRVALLLQLPLGWCVLKIICIIVEKIYIKSTQGTILKGLVQADGICRVIFCTIADVPNVHILSSTMVHLQILTITFWRVDVLPAMVNIVNFQYPGRLVMSQTRWKITVNWVLTSAGELSSFVTFHPLPQSPLTPLNLNICYDHCTVGNEPRPLYLLSGQQHTQDYSLSDVETRSVSSEQRV